MNTLTPGIHFEKNSPKNYSQYIPIGVSGCFYQGSLPTFSFETCETSCVTSVSFSFVWRFSNGIVLKAPKAVSEISRWTMCMAILGVELRGPHQDRLGVIRFFEDIF